MRLRSDGIGAVLAAGFAASCAASSLDLATDSIDRGDYEAAAAYLEQCAAEGDERCDYIMARLMFSGELAGESDPVAAAERMRRAAIAGHPEAQADMGKLYQSGRGVEKDLAKAAEWYRLAAEAGEADAQANLGWMYQSGRGVDRDSSQAAEWYRKAALQGHPMGQGALGLALFQGNGVPKDVVEGYTWTILAAENQDSTALSNMGEMKSQMTSAQLAKARGQAADLRSEAEKRPPRRSRLRDMRTQQQHKERGDRQRSISRPRVP